MDHLQRIDMAARVLDMTGDTDRAVALLEQVVREIREARSDDSLPELVEALVFLAEVHWEEDNITTVRRYIAEVDALDLDDVEPDLVDPMLDRLDQIRLIVLE